MQLYNMCTTLPGVLWAHNNDDWVEIGVGLSSKERCSDSKTLSFPTDEGEH